MSANVEVSDNFCGSSLVPGPSRNHVGVGPVDGILNCYFQLVIEWIGQLIQDVIGNLTVRWTVIFKGTQLSNAFVSNFLIQIFILIPEWPEPKDHNKRLGSAGND